MIPVQSLIDEFITMRDEHWSYVFGAARKGEVDCSGAFVYAYKQHGASIAHGSNSIIRQSIVKLLPISQAKPGMIACKIKAWTNTSADTSNKWCGSEPGNCYHVGLVIQNGSKMSVIEAKGTNYGVVESDLNSSWTHVAELSDVNYSDQIVTFESNAQVSITSGYLNFRETPITSGKVLGKLYNGDRINVIQDLTDWYRCETVYGIGYVASRYVKLDEGVNLTDSEEIYTFNPPKAKLVVVDDAGNIFYPVGNIQVILRNDDESID